MQQQNWKQLMEQAKNAGGGEPLPDGDYPVVCAEAELKTTQTGKPMIKTKFKVTEPHPYAGRTVWNQFVISAESDQAMQIFFRQMAALGLTEQFFDGISTTDEVATALVGRPAVFTLTSKVWEGQKRNEVKAVKSSNGIAPGVSPAPTPPAPQPAAAAAVPPAPAAAPEIPAPAPAPQPAAPVAPAPAPAPPAAPAPAPAPPMPTPPVPAPPVGPDGVPQTNF